MTNNTLTQQTFAELGIDKDIVDALSKEGISHATEIQASAIPKALNGRDVIGRSQTGSGKTLAFSLPILQELRGKSGKSVRALVLAPTRELAKQIEEVIDSVKANSGLETTTIYGGVAYEPQFEALESADIVVGTPGRVIDLIKQNKFDISRVEFFVLDEADRMLDMGFIDDIRYIINKLPTHKQNFFFSATMPGIARDLASSFMHNPEMVATKDVFVDNNRLDEYYVDCPSLMKADMCRELLIREEASRALVFTNSRLWSDKLAEYFAKSGIKADALHGAYSQNKREQVVKDFETGKIQVLVATDVAARGLDIEDVSHVINFEVARDEQSHTHRVGRTARAGKSGIAITLLDREEHRPFARIEGDSLRDVKRYDIDYNPKKVYLTPKRNDRVSKHGGNRSHSRKGRHQSKSSHK